MVTREMERRWVDFVHGRWVSKVPSGSGTYPTSTEAGGRGPDIVVETNAEGASVPTVEWNGLWWSKPYPSLPSPETVTSVLLTARSR